MVTGRCRSKRRFGSCTDVKKETVGEDVTGDMNGDIKSDRNQRFRSKVFSGRPVSLNKFCLTLNF